MREDTLAPHRQFMKEALEQARVSFEDQGGIPVGAVMVRAGQVIARGHNNRVQKGSPILHGETDCIQNLGRQKTYRDVTLYTTLSPCMMCAGTIVQFGIPRVVVGQTAVDWPADKPFTGNVEFLKQRGVEVILLEDPACKALFDEFLRKNPEVWLEDIGEE
ncbi:nucleoside deaminase [Shumkonia mesophila]|uniref:nucleoside deaminase n=1 Tax=Shumkonia mesophila TaxID=2838854 RepID=UPI0029343D51|nr:nucleoside deaminase [Shumkonia mesophila]